MIPEDKRKKNSTRILQKAPKKDEEEDLKIEVTGLKGNNDKYSSMDIDKREDYSESMLRFDFDAKMKNVNYNGGFKVKYSTIIKPKPDFKPETENSYTAIIVVGVILAILIVVLTPLWIRRQNSRKASAAASSTGERLNDHI